MSESGVDDGVNRADTRASQHGHGAFDGERHVDDDAIALYHPQRFQTVGEAADQAIELAVGDDALGAVFAEPDESGAVAALGVGMTVERVDGDVGLRAGEPLVMDAIPLENLAPRMRPLEAARVVGPEDFWIFKGALALGVPIFLQDVVGDDRGRRIFLIEIEQVGDVFRFGQGKRAHAKNLRERRVTTWGRRGFCCGLDSRAVIRITGWCVFPQVGKAKCAVSESRRCESHPFSDSANHRTIRLHCRFLSFSKVVPGYVRSVHCRRNRVM